MSLCSRKPRPLKRDDSRLRDDRLFIVACDDTYAPKQYFNFFRFRRVHVHVVPTDDGTSTAEAVLDRLLSQESEEDDERWLLLDTDHCTQKGHVRGFKAALRRASQLGINVALSKPSFELWLLLHHVDESSVGVLRNATQTESALRSALKGYDKTCLRQDVFPLASVVDAYFRAKTLDASVSGGDIPLSNTSRVYRLWKSIAEKALPSELPPELQAIKDDL